MAYNYEEEKQKLLTLEGQEKLLRASELFKSMLKETGAATKGRLHGKLTGDGWECAAIVDRIVEINNWIVLKPYPDCAYQHEVVVSMERVR